MSHIIRATIVARQRLTNLVDDLSDERGDGPVDNAIIIGLGVTLGLGLLAAVTAAFNGYLPKIK